MQSALLHLFGSYYAWFHFYPDNEAMQSYIEQLTKSEVIVCTFGSFMRTRTRSNICDEM